MEKMPPTEIWLLPTFAQDVEYGWVDYVWSEDPAPEVDMDPNEAIPYVRADDRTALERALKKLRETA